MKILDNEKALAHHGLLRHGKKSFFYSLPRDALRL
jgi:hypothetical protein